jgi:hypothetical protein
MWISWKKYEKSCQDYQKNWALLNQTLYDLCKNYRDHQEMSAINAKLRLIGRTLATGIERMIESTGEQGSSLDQLAYHIHKNHKKMDSIFTHLSMIAEPLNSEKLRAIVDEHGRFLKLLAPKMRKGVSPRSFASKYMHFHCPAVPIYDSYASSKLFSYRWNDR